MLAITIVIISMLALCHADMPAGWVNEISEFAPTGTEPMFAEYSCPLGQLMAECTCSPYRQCLGAITTRGVCRVGSIDGSPVMAHRTCAPVAEYDIVVVAVSSQKLLPVCPDGYTAGDRSFYADARTPDALRDTDVCVNELGCTDTRTCWKLKETILEESELTELREYPAGGLDMPAGWVSETSEFAPTGTEPMFAEYSCPLGQLMAACTCSPFRQCLGAITTRGVCRVGSNDGSPVNAHRTCAPAAEYEIMVVSTSSQRFRPTCPAGYTAGDKSFYADARTRDANRFTDKCIDELGCTDTVTCYKLKETIL